MTRISEAELVLPVLYVLLKGSATTSELIRKLRRLLHPTGEDLKILAGRNDDKFSQKVRNLKAHNTLLKMGVAREEGVKGGSTVFAITDEGRRLYEDQKDNLATLFSFDLEKTHRILSGMATGRRPIVLTDETMISEGGVIDIAKRRARQRSKILRDAAVEYYTHDGRIECHACLLEFSRHYGPIGKIYIEIHHLNPICEYEGEVEIDLDEAIKEVRPLCANCHRVVHLHKPILTIKAVKEALCETGVLQ